MAEFPHLGSHCDVQLCNQLDFLPIKCDACQGSFCTQHFVYDLHNCENSYQKSVQVPVCPMCNQPIPTPRGIPVDFQVNEHIQNNCEKVKKKQIYKNRCSVQGCKKKELIPITCPSCNYNYCLAHRHESDHKCEQILAEIQSKSTSGGFLSNAIAALSLNRNSSNNCSSQARNTQVSSDEEIARALQQQEYESPDQTSSQTQRSRHSVQNSCSVS